MLRRCIRFTFMFWGEGLFVFLAIYTAVSYSVFRRQGQAGIHEIIRSEEAAEPLRDDDIPCIRLWFVRTANRICEAY